MEKTGNIELYNNLTIKFAERGMYLKQDIDSEIKEIVKFSKEKYKTLSDELQLATKYYDKYFNEIDAAKEEISTEKPVIEGNEVYKDLYAKLKRNAIEAPLARERSINDIITFTGNKPEEFTAVGKVRLALQYCDMYFSSIKGKSKTTNTKTRKPYVEPQEDESTRKEIERLSSLRLDEIWELLSSKLASKYTTTKEDIEVSVNNIIKFAGYVNPEYEDIDRYRIALLNFDEYFARNESNYAEDEFWTKEELENSISDVENNMLLNKLTTKVQESVSGNIWNSIEGKSPNEKAINYVMKLI